MVKKIVLKVGGSVLFSKMTLEQHLAPLFKSVPNSQIYMIVGGGELVESMRLLHSCHPSLNAKSMHWHCVSLLATTLNLAAELTPSIPVLKTWEAISQSVSRESPGHHWVSIDSFYHRSTSIPDEFLPEESWNTTSDSLAWLLAWQTGIKEVLLLKSCSIEHVRSLDQAVEEGIVDQELARLSGLEPSIRIHLRNSASQIGFLS